MPDLLHWLENCTVCPNFCRVNRRAGFCGRCRTTDNIVVSSASLHFGEEPMLVGRSGSGTIFFTACNLACVFCQNYDISQLDQGQVISPGQLVKIIFSLQDSGALNINLVSPTHQAPQIFEVIREAKGSGLRIPVVYNCGGYENPEFLRELEGLVDIYMPDFKYADKEAGDKYSGVRGYTTWVKKALLEMYRQVGDLEIDNRGTARRGLLVRHLVLPHDITGSKEIIDFIADEISSGTVINIMDQYHPCYRANEYKELSRRIFRSEVEDVIDYAKARGLMRVLS
jgi:putative pyruvate formate lyase activating enzyme